MSRSGATAGADTYVDAAIKAAGGQNLITSPGWQSRDPEFLLSLEPDLIVTSFFTDGYESVQAKSIRNRVLRDFLDRHPQLDICLLYTSPSPRDRQKSRMPSSA